MNKFSVGDRVKRTLFHDEGTMRGTVIRVYDSTPDHQGRTDTLYEVKWDYYSSPRSGYLYLEKDE